MSKELKNISRQLDERIKLVDSDNELVNINISIGAIKEVKQVLRAPTEQEVCEALSEYYQMEVIYTENSLCSIFTLKHKKHVGNSVCFYDKSDNIITFWSDLPPNLITLIGRFYEALTKGSERE